MIRCRKLVVGLVGAVLALSGCENFQGGAEPRLSPPQVSVFTFSINDVAKERGVSTEEAARLLKEAGVSGFDCDFADRRLDEYAATGLRPSNLYGQMAFLAADGGAARAQAFVDTAVRVGCPRIMLLTDDFTNGEANEAEFAKIVDGVRMLVAKGRARGITVMIETYGNRKNCCSYASYVTRLLEAVPDLAFAADTGNLHYAGRGDDVVALVKRMTPRIAHVHLKDFDAACPVDDVRRRRPYCSIGLGAVPNEEIVRHVHAMGYDGWYTLEYPIKGDTLGDVRRQVATLRGWLERLPSRTVDVTLWRGETATTILHDHVAVGTAPEGFDVKVGVAKEVRYLDSQFGTHYFSFADRVVWGDGDVGVKVLSVTAGPDVAPGTYFCGDVRIVVLDRTLPPPSEWRYRLDLWQHPWAVARWNDVEPFSEKHFAAMEPLWRMLADAGCKTLTTTLIDLPWNHQCYDAYHSMIRRVRTKDGTWRFDYGVFDRYVEFGRRCGLGPDIACYTMCPWEYVVRWEDENGAVKAMKAIPGTSEFEMYWSDFLVDFSAHLKAKGWFKDTYIAMDERMPEDVRNIVRLVNAKAPGLKIALAGSEAPSQFKGLRIDSCCVGLHRIRPELIAEAAARRKEGLITTYYVCCGPAYPNTFCSSRLEESFWLGAYPGVVGLDGFLRWAWNSWPQDPIRDASYTGILSGWKAGDTFLVYPDGSPSLRFLELRNGIVAAEKLRVLKEKGLFAREIAALEKAYDRDQAIKNACNFVRIRAQTQAVVNK